MSVYEILTEVVHAEKLISGLQAATGETHNDLNRLYSKFLTTTVGSYSDLNKMERTWLLSATGADATTDTNRLLKLYLEGKGYSGALIDMVNASGTAGDIFTP